MGTKERRTRNNLALKDELCCPFRHNPTTNQIIVSLLHPNPNHILERRVTISHIVTVRTKMHDPTAISAACARLGLPTPVQGKAELYSGEASGLLVQLPDWTYPAVIDVQSGEVRFDNYDGAWGDPSQLDRFLQLYAVEKAKIEARKNGFTITEQTLQDGAIKVQMIEGGT